MLQNALKLFQKTHQFIGHRGSPLKAAENTIQSLRQLADDGVHSVEFDVRLTKDNKAVVFHDDNIKRMTSGRGVLRKKTYDELSQYDVIFESTFPKLDPVRERIPLFKDYLKVCAELNMQMVVECKADKGTEAILAEQVKKNLDQYWSNDLLQPVISSYSSTCIKAFKEIYGDEPVWLAANVDKFKKEWREWDQSILTSAHLWDRHIKQEQVEQLKATGFGVMVFTVNDVDRARELFDWGVDAVFSDEAPKLQCEYKNDKGFSL